MAGRDRERDPGEAPESWRPVRRIVHLARAPVERFLAIEAASGIVLLACAALALGWANSPWSESYFALWHAPVGLTLGAFSFERDLHFWINDGVMTIFFFVVGLEIRREMHRGELSDLRRAALPLAAALGGMLAPAGIFLALNAGRATAGGWGIPMATDIAFAVGVLALLGSRVPPALRVFLLALAVIDDVGAILVIAVFYSSALDPAGFAVLGAGLGSILVLQAAGVRSPWAYVPSGVLAWAGAYGAGIHPTLAGVAVGLLTPVRAWLGTRGFVERARGSVDALDAQEGDDEHAAVITLEELNRARREAVSPAMRVQHALHAWVAFGAMPLFALANAGVVLGETEPRGDSLRLFLGVGLGLVAGKPIGVLGLAWAMQRLGLAALPTGVGWRQLAVAGLVAGIGFTMSIFIAQLAFAEGAALQTAKASVLAASVAAAILGYALGRSVLRAPPGGAP